MVQIVPITPALIGEYKQVRLRALKDSPTSFGSTYLRESQLTEEEWIARTHRLHHTRDRGYLAQHDGKYVGIAICLFDDEDPRKAELISMWVAPEQRRLGVGVLLVNAVTTWAAEHGAHTLSLMVTSINHAAMEFYSALGFSLTEHRASYPNDPTLEEYQMSKTLR